MRKIVALVLVTMGFAVALPSVAGADDVNGPQCADIASGNGVYSGDGFLSVVMTLGDAPCRAFEYTLHVQTSAGELNLSPVQVINGNQLIFQTSLDPAANPTICVYATVSVGEGHHVFDIAPDVPKDCAIGLSVALNGGFATSFN